MDNLIDYESHPLESLYDSRILIVDDVASNRQIIVDYLKAAGFQFCETAINGVDALQKVILFQPDIMILDLLMPEMNGVEVIKKLRAHKTYCRLPIIVQTSISEPEQRIDAWDSGANDVIIKPIHHLELISRVTVQLKNIILIKALEHYSSMARQDISQAFELQKSLLSSPENLHDLEHKYGLNIRTLFAPARFLSGDIWGLTEVGENQLGIWIGDFAGKGIRAALNTFRLHTLIQEYKHCMDDPSEMIDVLNSRLMPLMPIGQFTTFLIGIMDLHKNLFTYASASSPHPLVYYPKERRFIAGDGSGVPLGIEGFHDYPLRTLAFPKGAALVLHSDLLWDTEALPGISMRPEDLDILAVSLEGQGIVNTIEKYVNVLEDFTISDDLTLIEIARPEG